MAEYSRAQLEAAADAYANAYSIPPNIYRSLIAQESSWNPYAQSKKSTAYGLTQLIKGTADYVGVTDITDPMQQLRGGADYLSQMKEKFGDWRSALAAYNQGPGGDLSKGAGYAAKILGNAGGLGNVPVFDAMGNMTGAVQSDDPVTAANAAGFTSGGIGEFFSGKMTDIGFVVLGVVVLAGAIFMLAPGKNIVVNLAKKAVA